MTIFTYLNNLFKDTFNLFNSYNVDKHKLDKVQEYYKNLSKKPSKINKKIR